MTTDLTQGALYHLGLLSPEQVARAQDLLAEVASSELETIRVLFADQHGLLRGKTITSDALPSIFQSGINMPGTLLLKDTSHRTVFPVWSDGDTPGGLSSGAGDILLVPDTETFRRLPWAPHSAWIFCDPVTPTGGAIPFAPRPVLRTAIDQLAAANRALTVGLEVEFQVFTCTDPRLNHSDSTMPGTPVATQNLTQGYQFLTAQVYDIAEPLLDDLRRAAQSLGLPIRSMEIEMGPSQFEFTFDPADPMTHADNMMMLRAMTKSICARKGLHATFMCKPNHANACANGWHLHQSLTDTVTDKNLMIPNPDGSLSQTASGWIAGLLEHAHASCLLTTPTVNGYKRYQPHQLAPDRVLWGHDNRGAMIRALMAPGDPASRIENRVADPTANPYYFFASQILSGLDGLSRALTAPDPVETPYLENAPRLPGSLLAAIQAFEGSTFYRRVLGDPFVDYLSHIRRAEWDRYHLAISDWEQAEYFNQY
ncbi:glutamine synthetase family protein [Shimia abyssi]|uniref:Glutamine synthetase n=1 Tax=Shimia abyssi TaxID=1662395 RepID=A0A2P8F5Y2_9RHOB|nr:glutamine synthetase family protein [Shimia abyssi]PSL17095.1 glutamine synthetase [Shimia abyssi]